MCPPCADMSGVRTVMSGGGPERCGNDAAGAHNINTDKTKKSSSVPGQGLSQRAGLEAY